ncbi:MAG: hypothetical protein QOK04_2858 [Solirubrobacteraceae bacterium]|nr:hypothetical protein [Solirubrobacteraceae bacterium]
MGGAAEPHSRRAAAYRSRRLKPHAATAASSARYAATHGHNNALALCAPPNGPSESTKPVAPPVSTVTLEPNASVTEHGDGPFKRRRRVLVLGLPLLHILTAAELRSVLAHEFGHYAGGDTRLGWTYRVRAAIGRTIDGLHDDDSFLMRVIQRPFIWYGKAFLRITNAISRRQEFAADAWAARVAGRDTHLLTLRKIHRLGPAYDAYWAQEVMPVPDSGTRPPVGAGFARFVTAPTVSKACDDGLASELEVVRSDPYSSHPTLPERLAAAEALPAGDADSSDPRPALELVEGPEEVETRTLEALARAGGVERLDAIDWDEVGERVYLRRFEASVAEHAGVVRGQTIASLPGAAANPGAIARQAFGSGVGSDTHALVLGTLGAALAVALARQGWRVEAPFAEPVVCRRGEDSVVPFEVVERLASGDLTADAWRETCASLGIDDAPLDAQAPATAEPVAS